jgi:hypothetical protein
MRTTALDSTVRNLLTTVSDQRLRELFVELAVAALRCLTVSPEPTDPASIDKARRHWSRARRDAHNAQQRERRRAVQDGAPKRRDRGGNGRVSPEALWRHARKLEPKEPWRAVVRELGVGEINAQNAERNGTLPVNISPAAVARFLAL